MSVVLPERKQENNTMERIIAANDWEVQVPRTAKLQTRHQHSALAKGAVKFSNWKKELSNKCS
jgi:hypothetical protein